MKWILFFTFLLYAVLAFCQPSVSWGPHAFGLANTFFQVTLDALLSFVLFKKVKRSTKSASLRFLLVAFMFMTLGDFVYGFAVNIFKLSNLRGTYIEDFYNTVFLIAHACVAFYFIRSMKDASQKLQKLSIALTGAMILIFAILFGNSLFGNGIPLYTVLVHTLALICKATIISVGSLNSILYRSSWRRIIASGFLIMLSYSTLLEYLEVTNAMPNGFPMEIFWTFGLLTILFGINRFEPQAQHEIWDPRSLSTKLTLNSLALSAAVILSWLGLHAIWEVYFRKIPEVGLATSWAILLLVCMGLYSLSMRSLLVEPMTKLTGLLRSVNKDGEPVPEDSLSFGNVSEFNELSDEILVSFQALYEEKVKTETLSRLASRMSHDIRSPLAALRMLTGQTEGLNENTRQLIIQIASRINLIAENLLSEHRENSNVEASPKGAPCLVYGVVESIVSEKRILLPHSRILIDLNVSKDAYFCWGKLDSENMGRILSNLINNSIEAFTTNPLLSNPRVTVDLSRYDDQFLRLSIQDNGGGIPENIEASLKAEKQVTSKTEGTGLGLSQARETLRTVNGKLDLITQFGFGTVTSILIPIQQAPRWFANDLAISDQRTTLILDDDFAIHAVWKSKLPHEIKVVNCFTLEEAEQQVARFNTTPTVLVDYHLRGSRGTGLDFIKSAQVQKYAYLVTSHFEDAILQAEAERLGVKILPKFLVPFIQLRSERAQKSEYDLLLIDDDPLIKATWSAEAKRNNKSLYCSGSVDAVAWEKVNLETPIFIDRHLGPSLDGVNVAKLLYDRGYRNLFISSGEGIRPTEENLEFIQGFLGKDFPLAKIKEQISL